MSAVVIRCPNCGTTQSALGECEACHDAEVRHFCPNHKPGRWLDGARCDACGATVGSGPARPTPPSTPPRRSPSPTPPRPPSRTPPRPPRARAGTPPRRVPVDVGGAPREFEEVVVAPPVRRGPERPPPAMRVPVATGLGCLARTMLFLVVATLLLTVVPILGLAIAGGAMREWAVDLGQRFGLVEGVPAQTQRGIEAYRAGDLVTAERELREAADSYRRSAVALIYLARMRMDAGDLERGGEYLEEAVLREPDNAVAHRELAGYHLTRASRLLADRRGEAYGRDELLRAEQHYVRALQLDPADRRARGYYACVLTDLGRQADAERALAQAGSGAWDACARPAARPTP